MTIISVSPDEDCETCCSHDMHIYEAILYIELMKKHDGYDAEGRMLINCVRVFEDDNLA